MIGRFLRGFERAFLFSERDALSLDYLAIMFGMPLLKNLCVLLLSIFLFTGCAAAAAIIGALPTIVQIVQDALIVLDQIDTTAKPFFERSENKELLDSYNKKMGAAKSALQVALRASEGGKELSDSEIDAAFDDFRDAYKELLSLLRDNNLMTAEGSLKTAGGANIDVLTPLAISRAEK